jgi:small subunit ribosomal protein S2
LSQVTIKQLLEAGVHFGHQTQRWNPKMKKYIFGERNGIYIINLEITLSCLDKAMNFLKKIAGEGKEILLVGTKRQAQEPIRDVAERCGMPYVQQRWLGGMLTNFETIKKSVARLDEIDQMEKEGSFSFVTKKEVGMLKKEREKLVKNLSGIRKMRRLPSALFVIDSKKEEIAIQEASKLGIPIVAVLDTNCDPDKVDYPVPGNDDAIRAVKLFCEVAFQAITEGRTQYAKPAPPVEAVPAEEGDVPAAVSAETDSFATAMEGTPEDRIEEKLAARFAGNEEEVDKEKLAAKVKKSPRKDKPK